MAYFRCTTSGSGTGATITVSYESEVYGQTLTCTDGTHTYTKTAASTGSTVFTVPNGGTWTISVVMYGHTYSQQVIVVSEYTCTLALWSATVNISTTATELYSQNITVKKGGSTIGSTAFDSSGSATYIAPEEGTYTFECTYSGQTYSASVNVTEETTYSVVISMGLELSQWLTAGGLDPSDYADLSEVLADQEAIRRLMTIHDSVDYLATASAGDEMMETIIADDVCAKWINLRDYAFDVLSANTDIKAVMDEIDKYGYGEWVCEGQVPVMTSDTAPYGEVSCSSQWSTSANQAWCAFDGNDSTYWVLATGVTSGWIQYKFINPTKVKLVKINTSQYLTNIKIQGSNDGSTWTDLTDTITELSNGWNSIPLANDNSYIYYRASVVMSTANQAVAKSLQFYAYQPKGNVPIMTSNTAPYGEASASTEYSATYAAFNAFNNILSGLNAWRSTTSDTLRYIAYKFTNPICVKGLKWLGSTYSEDYFFDVDAYIEYSNDGTTWTTADTIAMAGTDGKKFNFNNIDADTYALYWRVRLSNYNRGADASTRSNCCFMYLQFYGREMKSSVPYLMNQSSIDNIETAQGMVLGSTQVNAIYKAAYAFKGDNRSYDYWSASLPAYVGYKFKFPFVMKKLCIGHYSGSIASVKNGYLQASNNGTDWVNIIDVDDSIASRDSWFDVDNDNPYYYWRLYAPDSYYSSGQLLLGICQFFGFDYSERDWDTEHPMRYLYDHGVEVEEMDTAGIKNNSGYTNDGIMVDKYSDYMKSKVYDVAAYKTKDIVNKNAIDLTSYNLLRGISDLKIDQSVDVSAITGNGNCGYVLSQDASTDGFYLMAAQSTLMVAVISINYHTTRNMEITELWLE